MLQTDSSWVCWKMPSSALYAVGFSPNEPCQTLIQWDFITPNCQDQCKASPSMFHMEGDTSSLFELGHKGWAVCDRIERRNVQQMQLLPCGPCVRVKIIWIPIHRQSSLQHLKAGCNLPGESEVLILSCIACLRFCHTDICFDQKKSLNPRNELPRQLEKVVQPRNVQNIEFYIFVCSFVCRKPLFTSEPAW
mmetsp:Transcript_10690/g.65905  ORF Transcript_10690/g.65905 Transcript_10690/m.65905 type:complete len:192 (+) Transcript_10690:863-1438(+)